MLALFCGIHPRTLSASPIVVAARGAVWRAKRPVCAIPLKTAAAALANCYPIRLTEPRNIYASAEESAKNAHFITSFLVSGMD